MDALKSFKRMWHEKFEQAAVKVAEGKDVDIEKLVLEAKAHLLQVAKVSNIEERKAVDYLTGGLKLIVDISKQPKGFDESILKIIDELKK